MQKLAKFTSNTDKVHYEVLLHLLRYIMDNKTLLLKYYADMNNAPVSDLLRQDRIKNENQFMVFSDSSCQDCPDTGISTVAYIIFYQGGSIDHCTYVPVPLSQSGAESEYNAACTAGITLTHLRMLIHEWLNKDLYIVP